MIATGIATDATAAVDVTAAATWTAVGACDSAPARRENSSVGQKIEARELAAARAHGTRERRAGSAMSEVRAQRVTLGGADHPRELLLDERLRLGALERLLAGLDLLAEADPGARQQRLGAGGRERPAARQISECGAPRKSRRISAVRWFGSIRASAPTMSSTLGASSPFASGTRSGSSSTSSGRAAAARRRLKQTLRVIASSQARGSAGRTP